MIYSEIKLWDMRYSEIKLLDIANGPGVRVSLFVQGCNKHCTGCFNPNTWDYNGGKQFTSITADNLLNACKPSHIEGLSILGGEPFDSAIELSFFMRVFNSFFNNPKKTKNVMVWSGYTWDEIVSDPDRKRLLNEIDILVDGRFDNSLKDPRLIFRGSSNQRIINVRKSLKYEKIVLCDIHKSSNGYERSIEWQA